MPLLIAALESTPGLPGAGTNTSGANATAVANTWATAVGAWAAAILPPSTTVTAAKATLQTTLATLFAANHATSELSAFASSLESAHLAFATTVGGGMAGYAPTPPIGQIGFAGLLTAPAKSSGQDAANAIASALDTWMKTGIATLAVTPFTVVPWS